MCTVTFIPLANNDFILTSNRDESKLRETLHPQKYFEDGVEMIYPKDKIAGGTWIGTSSKKRLVCVLNGAFIKHSKKTKYKKSRGVIAKEILAHNNFELFINELNLNNIEPFTIIITDWNEIDLKLFELIWDGNKKYITRLKNEPKIWSSSTLYDSESKKLRITWFNNWLLKNDLSSKSILNFHHSKIGDLEQSIYMKRAYVETVSITSIKKEKEAININYEDLVHSKKSLFQTNL
ncbi:NRDE family protein [Lutibacter citreus]|uniref:NRDE family protein n=1 Tax=Lutibacter citreus TaxID=2138210 RepID=UPI000DBE2815|nr:NRDE family protein [Lutibacter citreus]